MQSGIKCHSCQAVTAFHPDCALVITHFYLEMSFGTFCLGCRAVQMQRKAHWCYGHNICPRQIAKWDKVFHHCLLPKQQIFSGHMGREQEVRVPENTISKVMKPIFWWMTSPYRTECAGEKRLSINKEFSSTEGTDTLHNNCQPVFKNEESKIRGKTKQTRRQEDESSLNETHILWSMQSLE